MEISVELTNHSHPVYFAPPLKGFSELCIDAGGQKTRMMGLQGQERSLMLPSAAWIQCTYMTDGRTGTPVDSKDHAYTWRRVAKIQ